jgi:hypothetical protein
MRFLIVDTYYKAFLDHFYAEKSGWEQQPYDLQQRGLMNQCFGTSDFYSCNLRRLGHEATEVVANCFPLQVQWAKERGLRLRHRIQRRSYNGFPIPQVAKDWFYPILRAQVQAYRPDVVHFQDPGNTDPDFVREIRPHVRLISGQIASPIPSRADFRPYDLVLSSFPHFVECFYRKGIRSAHFNAGFEPQILQRLKKTPSYRVVFVGGLSSSHKDRIQFLEEVSHQTDLDWWGYGIDSVTTDSPLRQAYRGPAWALEMYEKLFNACITLNHHIDVAQAYANNMRLYEATGVGSLLVTDAKSNLKSLFELGTEVVAYRNATECVELINYYLATSWNGPPQPNSGRSEL